MKFLIFLAMVISVTSEAQVRDVEVKFENENGVALELIIRDDPTMFGEETARLLESGKSDLTTNRVDVSAESYQAFFRADKAELSITILYGDQFQEIKKEISNPEFKELFNYLTPECTATHNAFLMYDLYGDDVAVLNGYCAVAKGL